MGTERIDFNRFNIVFDMEPIDGPNQDIPESGAYIATNASAELPQIPFGPDGPSYAIEIFKVLYYFPADTGTGTGDDVFRLFFGALNLDGAQTAEVVLDLMNDLKMDETPTAAPEGYPYIYKKLYELEVNPNIVDALTFDTPTGKQTSSLQFTMPKPNVEGAILEGEGDVSTSYDDITIDVYGTLSAGAAENVTPIEVDLTDEDGNGVITLATELQQVAVVLNKTTNVYVGGQNLLYCTVVYQARYKKLTEKELTGLAVRQAQFSF